MWENYFVKSVGRVEQDNGRKIGHGVWDNGGGIKDEETERAE